jgi:hypothetical protein
MMKKISEVLDINGDELKAAILKDHDETLTNYFNKATSAKKASPARDTSNIDVL